nr:hypothetical protein CFP56_31557 [Quercus suber]
MTHKCKLIQRTRRVRNNRSWGADARCECAQGARVRADLWTTCSLPGCSFRQGRMIVRDGWRCKIHGEAGCGKLKAYAATTSEGAEMPWSAIGTESGRMRLAFSYDCVVGNRSSFTDRVAWRLASLGDKA